jgi:hypothetical protein
MRGRPVGDVSVKIGGDAHGPVAAGVGQVIHVNGSEREAAVRRESGRRPDRPAAHRVVVTMDVHRSGSRNNDGQRCMRRALEECHAGAAALGAAVHVGYVDRVSGEWSGTPLVHAARLVDAPVVKRALEEAGDACVALVVSDAVKHVVDGGYCRIGPAGYRHVAVVVKETSCDAWWPLL